MYTTTFMRLPFPVQMANAPFIPNADVARKVPLPPLPVDAYWLFGVDNPNLLDQVGGLALAQNLSIAMTDRGSGYGTRPQVTLLGGGGTGWVLEANRADTEVSGVTILEIGTPFTSPPTVVFTGGTTGRVAQAVASIGAAPIINALDMTIPYSADGIRNGLLTPFVDSRDETIMAVIKALPPSVSISTVIMGSLAAANEGGSGLFFRSNDDKYQITTRPGSNTPLELTGAIAGQYMFVAVRHRSLDNYRCVTFGIGGQLVHFESIQAKTLANPLRKVALGNAHLVAANYYGALDIAGAAYAARCQSNDELLLAYQRFNFEVAERGGTVI